MPKKKVLFVINNLKIGGIQKSLVNLLKGISNYYDVYLIVFSENGKLFNELPSNITLIKVNKVLSILGLSQKEVIDKGIYLWLLRSLGAVWSKFFGNFLPIRLLTYSCKIKESFDFAISYAQFAEKNYFSGGSNEFVLNSVSAKEKITFLHCDFQRYGGNCRYTRKKYHEFDKIVACSEGTKLQFIKILPELKDKTFVVHNFNDFSKIYRLSKSNEIQYNDDVLNIITVSRLSKEKALDRVIYAVKEAIDKGIKINYHIVGDGPERDRLQKLTELLNLKLYVNFFGEQKNPYQFMKNADLLIISSKHEAAPMIIDEAAYLGVPIFTTETISAKEMVTEKGIGWICGNDKKEFILSFLNIVSNEVIIKQKKERMKKLKVSNDKAYREFIKVVRI